MRSGTFGLLDLIGQTCDTFFCLTSSRDKVVCATADLHFVGDSLLHFLLHFLSTQVSTDTERRIRLKSLYVARQISPHDKPVARLLVSIVTKVLHQTVRSCKRCERSLTCAHGDGKSTVNCQHCFLCPSQGKRVGRGLTDGCIIIFSPTWRLP